MLIVKASREADPETVSSDPDKPIRPYLTAPICFVAFACVLNIFFGGWGVRVGE